jgi:hypothetical protein
MARPLYIAAFGVATQRRHATPSRLFRAFLRTLSSKAVTARPSFADAVCALARLRERGRRHRLQGLRIALEIMDAPLSVTKHPAPTKTRRRSRAGANIDSGNTA